MKRTFSVFLAFCSLGFASLSTAQKSPVQIKEAGSNSCKSISPKQAIGAPRVTNFCECLPKGYINADPASISGVVDVQFDVGVEGNVTAVRLVKSSSIRYLDRYVMDAVAKCKFEPAHMNGKAIASSLMQRYIIEDSNEVGENGEGIFVENIPRKQE